MALVEYSDSEASGDDGKPTQPVRAASSAKPNLQKVVDSSNPRKIRVNLPEPVQGPPTDSSNADEPPAKRARIGGGGLGFNAMLPAPKKQVAPATSGPARKGGLGRGVNLKTGATPGFSREPMPILEQEAEQEQEQEGREEESANAATQSVAPPAPVPATRGNAMMFKPLSVARKPQQQKKKKNNNNNKNTPTSSTEDIAALPTQGNVEVTSAPKRPKVSLFTMDASDPVGVPSTESSTGDYQPMVYQSSAAVSNAQEEAAAAADEQATWQAPGPGSASHTAPDIQSLDSIASDLNLSASARRQLLGRGRQGAAAAAAVNVTNFNTDAEWAANEELRAAGEQAAHNPVRALAAGKHSLKQLVNAVSTQKDALEEQFASGRRNRKEAGSRYGW